MLNLRWGLPAATGDGEVLERAASNCHGDPPLTLRPSYGIRYVGGFGRCVRIVPAARFAVKRAAATAVVGTVLDFRVAAGDAPYVDDGSKESTDSSHVGCTAT
ncbi:hypothetical protein SLEP1_g58532 [Rubroshorea leprosula]|uniref:Uncharacterized protein n=1 Tax=Rubroshorea leprosula TaxID=152421 RepID=A0AAV5MQU0_9ROSI|nr:hypothetical protein SLEP1_g58532 [Rubroshorea leprosula]